MKKHFNQLIYTSLFSILLLGCAKQNLTLPKEQPLQNPHAGKNSVTYKSQGPNLAGDIYLPEGFEPSKQYPTVLFSGPFNQIKEQTGAVYAKKLIQKGYVVLVFDHLGYGESQGALRDNENSYIKMESIRDSISYLRTLSFVNKEKLYGLGVCASGGYMPLVGVIDKRLKAIATVSGMMDNKASYFGTMNKEQLLPLFAMANEARQKAYETGKVEYYDALGFESLKLDKLDKESAYYEGYDYYMTKRVGKVTYPNYIHLAPKILMENAPLTSATDYAPYLYTPYLGIYGEKALKDTGPLTVAFYKKASEPKELFEVKGASHVSLYDNDKDVQSAVNKMDAFFKKY